MEKKIGPKLWTRLFELRIRVSSLKAYSCLRNSLNGFFLGQLYSHACVNTGRLERTETNLMHFKWEVTWSYGNQPNTF